MDVFLGIVAESYTASVRAFRDACASRRGRIRDPGVVIIAHISVDE
jgi:hypothetical protein